MKITKFDNEDQWLEARRGHITGTKAKDLVAKRKTTPKIGFYEIIAERIAIPATEEKPMERGKRLEDIAIKIFSKKTGKKINTDLVIWERDDNRDIAISPDGYRGKAEAVEVKCLSSARHIEAWLTKKIPSEYEYQALQYFVVNDDLKKLYFVFYDPRLPIDIFWIEISRSDIEDKIKEMLETERDAIKRIKEIENKLTF